jgi:TolB-like protein
MPAIPARMIYLTKHAVMNEIIPRPPEILLGIVAIEQQLERIFSDPHFTESEILKKFLSFIVQETLLGRSNCLKEYTIAINVLEKPVGFKPQENGIVRIHAGRLRRALSQYYSEQGLQDPIVITIPKGKYIPVFTDRFGKPGDNEMDEDSNYGGLPGQDDAKITLAVLPFICSETGELLKSFTEGLCMQMSSMLMQLNQISVIAYQAVRNLAIMHPDYKELGASVGFDHVITGGTQYTKDKLRVNMQLIECNSYRQIWSETYEGHLTKSNLFKVQDEVCQYAINKMEYLRIKKYDTHTISPVLSAI